MPVLSVGSRLLGSPSARPTTSIPPYLATACERADAGPMRPNASATPATSTTASRVRCGALPLRMYDGVNYDLDVAVLDGVDRLALAPAGRGRLAARGPGNAKDVRVDGRRRLGRLRGED